MNPDPNVTVPTQAPAPEAAPQAPGTPPGSNGGNSERYYTQAEVNQIISDRLSRERRKAEPAQPAKPETPVAAEPQDDSNANMPKWAREMKREGEFNESLADFVSEADVKLTPGQRGLLRSAFRSEKPAEMGEWLAQKVKDLGVGPRAPTNGASVPAPPAPTATVAPVTVDDIDRGMVHPKNLTADQVAQMGPEKTRDYVRKFYSRSQR